MPQTYEACAIVEGLVGLDYLWMVALSGAAVLFCLAYWLPWLPCMCWLLHGDSRWHVSMWRVCSSHPPHDVLTKSRVTRKKCPCLTCAVIAGAGSEEVAELAANELIGVISWAHSDDPAKRAHVRGQYVRCVSGQLSSCTVYSPLMFLIENAGKWLYVCGFQGCFVFVLCSFIQCARSASCVLAC